MLPILALSASLESLASLAAIQSGKNAGTHTTWLRQMRNTRCVNADATHSNTEGQRNFLRTWQDCFAVIRDLGRRGIRIASFREFDQTWTDNMQTDRGTV